MKKKIVISLVVLGFALSASAQQAKKDIAANHQLAGSTYYAYPGPQKALTPAPAGEHPFYISHYGRHGSRFLIDKNDYLKPLAILEEADAKGKLSPKGYEVLDKVKLMSNEALNRYGELTPLGAQQHKGIAKRMM